MFPTTAAPVSIPTPISMGGQPRARLCVFQEPVRELIYHPSVGVGLSVWLSSLALFCRFESQLNTARGDVPDAVPPGLLEHDVMALRGFNRPQGTAIAPQLEQIVPHTYQAPCAPHLVQTSQQKTTEPTGLLALAKYRLYDDLATAV